MDEARCFQEKTFLEDSFEKLGPSKSKTSERGVSMTKKCIFFAVVLLLKTLKEWPSIALYVASGAVQRNWLSNLLQLSRNRRFEKKPNVSEKPFGFHRRKLCMYFLEYFNSDYQRELIAKEKRKMSSTFSFSFCFIFFHFFWDRSETSYVISVPLEL